MKKLMAVGLAAYTLQATAFTPDGNTLARWALEYEANSANYPQGAYMGLVAGVADVYSDLYHPHSICIPEGAETGQIAKITAKWLKEHPEKLHENATELIWLALFDAFGPAASVTCPDYDTYLQRQKRLKD